MAGANTLISLRGLSRSGLGALLLMITVLAMLVVPLSPLMLDILFTFNITLALVVLLVVVYAQRPLDFAVFPTVLLIATLLRLGLNIASTRVVLLHGHTGGDAAGQVIEAFGKFVVGGSYTVGIVVFVILVIINFVVITKGAGRISEVSARFTLDAMPGKQMGIDADLNAGLITQEEAKQRRAEVTQEADFYGAMDGASKFVRGDAIAGILVVLINLIGGFAIGMWQHGLGFSEALHNYTLLTIGDGLVAQIPALVLSTAAAIMVTRVSSAQDMGEQILAQLFGNPRALGVAAAIMGVMGLVPGMPNAAFLTLAAVAGGSAYLIAERRREAALQPASAPVADAPAETRDLGWEDMAPMDIIGLEVGYRLIPLVDKHQNGQLMTRIKGVRKKLSHELGFLVPPVHIRDNLDLAPNAYRIILMGVTVGQAEVYPERELAINPGRVFGSVPGLPAKDPAFGLEALWIEPAQRDQAQTQGYTVVDASTVVATHLNSLLQNHAQELLGRDDVQQLLNNLAKTSPKLVEELTPKVLSLGVVQRVLQNLLQENIPIRDLRRIAETLAEHASRTQDPQALTAAVRIALGPSIMQHINGGAPELAFIALGPDLEQILQKSLQMTEGPGIEPGLAQRMQQGLADAARRQELANQTPVLITTAALRQFLSRFVRHRIPGLHVLSYPEIPDNQQIRVVATVG
ncbi:MAG: flagellar biosynthesis protein FlhA [Gammaproteobacteria bacterium]|nr:MAG: flagellar biosynthesis protein FlhA [Gammaproteobacteria bacterium]